MGHVLAIRVERSSVFGRRFWDNRMLLALSAQSRAAVGRDLRTTAAGSVWDRSAQRRGTYAVPGAQHPYLAVEAEKWLRRPNQSALLPEQVANLIESLRM
jgi:hypothetical protein